jgi:hypothetical protein
MERRLHRVWLQKSMESTQDIFPPWEQVMRWGIELLRNVEQSPNTETMRVTRKYVDWSVEAAKGEVSIVRLLFSLPWQHPSRARNDYCRSSANAADQVLN